jgi:hypothetical protein
MQLWSLRVQHHRVLDELLSAEDIVKRGTKIVVVLVDRQKNMADSVLKEGEGLRL